MLSGFHHRGIRYRVSQAFMHVYFTHLLCQIWWSFSNAETLTQWIKNYIVWNLDYLQMAFWDQSYKPKTTTENWQIRICCRCLVSLLDVSQKETIERQFNCIYLLLYLSEKNISMWCRWTRLVLEKKSDHSAA